jgi:hypothetical protein
MIPEQKSHENKWRESTITETTRFWQLVKQVLKIYLPETKKDLRRPQRAFLHIVIEENKSYAALVELRWSRIGL